MRMTRAAEREPVRWANGGGLTRELAHRAAGRGVSGPAFDWRLSLADIDRDGPFSALAGVDRCFAPVEGEVLLALPGGVRRVGDADAPLVFAGEAAPEAVLPGGAHCRALNLMTARARCAGRMRRVALPDGALLDAGWAAATAAALGGAGTWMRACFVQRGRLVAGTIVVPAGALLELDAADPLPRADGAVLLLEAVILPANDAAAVPALSVQQAPR